MIGLTKKSLTAAALTLIAGSALAGGNPGHGDLCHNIGGPRDLGANCEATGNCTYITEEGGQLLTLGPNQYLGIVIGASENSWEAHLAHGDGFVDVLYEPPLHLASVIGPHRASNVECLATRETTTQPPEPGN